MSQFDYPAYLASREWAERKEAVRVRSGGYCERCGVRAYESTHHITYANIGNEPLEDLLAVCNWCHAFLSAKSNYDPCADIAFVVIAVNRRDSRDTEGSTDWLNAIKPPQGRVIGKIPAPAAALAIDLIQPLTDAEGQVLFSPECLKIGESGI